MPRERCCPYCRTLLPEPDAATATLGQVTCTRCTRTLRLADVWTPTEDDVSNPGTPPAGVVADLDADTARVVVRWRGMRLGWLLLVPFTVVWLGVLIAIVTLQVEAGVLDGRTFLMTLPAIVVALASCAAMVVFLRRTWSISLRDGCATVSAGVGRFGRTRRFPYSRSTRAQLYPTAAESDRAPAHHTGIWVRTEGADARFGASLGDAAKRYVARAILAVARRERKKA